MSKSWVVSSYLCAILLTLLAGCGGTGVGPDDAMGTPPLAALPAPSVLRTTSSAATRLFLWGGDYQDALSSSRTTRDGSAAVLTPDWTPPAATGADLAYATYRLNVSDYAGEALVHFDWTETGDFADAWVGLADWPHDRWQWFRLTDSGELAYDPAAQADATGELLVVVVTTGTAPWRLQAVYIDDARNWLVFGGNRQRTRRSVVNGPQSATEQWKVPVGSGAFYDPVIGPDGTVYLGDGDGYLRAITADGIQAWEYLTTEDIFITASPAVGPDGTIYIGTWDKYMYAVNPDGSPKWKYETSGFVESSAMVDVTGLIYFGSYILNPGGTLVRELATGDNYSGHTFGPTGNIYYGSLDGNLYCVNAAGDQQWAYPAGMAIWGAPAVADDGTIYFGCQDENIYAVNPDGSLQWSYPTTRWVWSSAAIGLDGSIVMGSDSSTYYALTADGALKWTFDAGGYARQSVTIGADGTIYCTGVDTSVVLPDTGRRLYALNPDDGSVKWQYAGGLGCPSIGPDGTLYVNVEDGYLAALRD